MKPKPKRKQLARYAKELRCSVFVCGFFKLVIGKLLTKRFCIYTSTPILNEIHAPYILIANHSTSFDPFIYIALCKLRMHFVASDAQFRNIFIRFLFRAGGTIAKKKGQHDLNTIAKMRYIAKHLKENICIFAEGVNTWDGASLEPIKGTANFIKYAKLPVYVARAHGAYLSYPRWGHSIRRGKVRVFTQHVLSKSQVINMKKEEIHNTICKALQYNEFLQQERFPQSFVSPQRAEYVERVLFACPHCKQTQKIVSNKQYFTCEGCKHRWFMDLQGFFRSASHIIRNAASPKSYKDRIDSNMYTWNTWQKSFLHTIIDKHPKNEIVFHDEECVLRYGTSRTSLYNGVGRLSLSPRQLHFIPNLDNTVHKYSSRTIDIQDLEAVNIQNKEILEWTQNKMFYQIKSLNPRFNAYKYMCAIMYIQGNESGQLAGSI